MPCFTTRCETFFSLEALLAVTFSEFCHLQLDGGKGNFAVDFHRDCSVNRYFTQPTHICDVYRHNCWLWLSNFFFFQPTLKGPARMKHKNKTFPIIFKLCDGKKQTFFWTLKTFTSGRFYISLCVIIEHDGSIGREANWNPTKSQRRALLSLPLFPTRISPPHRVYLTCLMYVWDGG